MNEIISNDLYNSIITQAIEEMKAEQGEKFSYEKINLAELERRTGVSRARLRRYKENGFQNLPDKRVGRHAKTSVLSGYTETIDHMLQQGITNSAVIFPTLQRLGYPGSLTVVKDYIRNHKDLVPAPRQIVSPQGNRGRRYFTEPGEAYQMDWGFVNVIDHHGNKSRIACFAMICHHCGKKYVEFFPNAKQENLFIGMIHAFLYMGIPEYVLTDNMKSVVIKRDFDGNPIWQKDYESFMKTLGFKTKLCKPYHPFTKGKVERLVRFVKDNFVQGRSFKNITELNEKALEWCHNHDLQYSKAIDNIPEMIHSAECGNVVKTVTESLEVLSYLCPKRRISFDGFVEYEGRRFGVPYKYSGRTVRVRRKKDKILIYAEDFSELLITHPVTWSRKDSYCINQYSPIEQPEELPTAPVRVSITKLKDVNSNHRVFDKFNFIDEEDDWDE